MNQAMVPVDGHKEEPQICVIEASMEVFVIILYPYGFLSSWSSFIQQICVDGLMCAEHRPRRWDYSRERHRWPLLLWSQVSGQDWLKLGDYSWGGRAAVCK